MLRADRKKLLY